MNRSSFLSTLITGTRLLTQAPEIIALGSSLNPVKTYPAIPIYSNFIRGFRFHAGPANLHNMQLQNRLDLVLEPQNPHDPFAVAIYWDGLQIGYMPREDNQISNAILAGGVPLYAEITGLDPLAPAWEQVEFTVYLITTPDIMGKDAIDQPDVIMLHSDKDGAWQRSGLV